MFSKRVRADIALAVTALIWGSTFVVVKDALADCVGVRVSRGAVRAGGDGDGSVFLALAADIG